MKYFKNTSWLFIEKIIRIMISIFMSVWIARYLGPEQFGLLSYVQSFVGLFSAISILGLDSIVVRELVKYKDNQNILLGTAFLLRIIGAFAMIFIITIAMYFTSNNQYTNILIYIIASATILQSFNVIDMFFQSEVLSKYVVFANAISLFISTIVKIILLTMEAPLISFAWIVLFDSFILTAGLIYFYIKNKHALITWKFDKNIAISLLRDSWPLIFSSVAIMIYMRIDQIMIKEMLGDISVGLYAVGIKFVEALYFIPMIITSSLLPAIIKLKENNAHEFQDKFQNLMTLMFWGSVLIIIPLYLYAADIILLFFGKEYLESYSVTEVYCWIFLFTSLGVTSSRWLLVENMQKFAMYRTYLGLVINIILNYILIPKYGIVGAAYASLISQIIASYLGYLTSVSTWKIFMIQTNAILPIYLLSKKGKK